jgi:hypothetical protein
MKIFTIILVFLATMFIIPNGMAIDTYYTKTDYYRTCITDEEEDQKMRYMPPDYKILSSVSSIFCDATLTFDRKYPSNFSIKSRKFGHHISKCTYWSEDNGGDENNGIPVVRKIEFDIDGDGSGSIELYTISTGYYYRCWKR